jgi:DNA (cytosine-5)-methyltransferase 1
MEMTMQPFQDILPLFDAPRTQSKARLFRSVELFAGAGGLGMGLARAGFRHEIVVERDNAACTTLRHNKARGFELVADWQIVEADVRGFDLSAVKPGADLMAAGVPCQPWSGGGLNAGAADDRNMWPWTVQATRKIAPRALCFENVRNFASTHADYMDYVKYQLRFPEITKRDDETERDHHKRLAAYAREGRADGLSYRVWHAVMNAADYGTAQHRHRVMIVGLRSDEKSDWQVPAPTHSESALDRSKWGTGAYWKNHGIEAGEPTPDELRRLKTHNQRPPRDAHLLPHRTVRDAVGDLGEPTLVDLPHATGHIMPPREARAYKGHTGSPIDKVGKAMRAGDHGVSGGENMINFGDRCRHFTKREGARLMDISDRYEFPGTWSDTLQQQGNAVPGELSYAVGQSIGAALAA